MTNYYCLVTGLPELSLEDGKLSYTVANFKTEIYPQLSKGDKKLVDLFYLKFDNKNLLAPHMFSNVFPNIHNANILKNKCAKLPCINIYVTN